MKYIRTESGIIYVGDLIKDEYGNYCDPKNYDTDMEVPNEYIIAEADTIEELCDEFIIDDKRNNVHYLMDYYDLIDEINNDRIYEEDIIYGAIWTDKGLKYVAKMDNWGKLVLI